MRVFLTLPVRIALAMTVALLPGVRPAGAGETIVGGGLVACDEYLNADDSVKLSMENWVLGFLTSANLRSHNLDLLNHMDNGTIIDAVDNYCRSYPSALIADASVELLRTLVASADGDCDRPGARSSPLSLCNNPGSPESVGQGPDIIVPAVE